MVNNILLYGVVVIRATRWVPLVEQELIPKRYSESVNRPKEKELNDKQRSTKHYTDN
jgi:hypothetical protein